jgi:hypothetical protein
MRRSALGANVSMGCSQPGCKVAQTTLGRFDEWLCAVGSAIGRAFAGGAGTLVGAPGHRLSAVNLWVTETE